MSQHIRTWTGGDFRLELYDTYRTDWRGASVLAYQFYHGDIMVFDGEDFCASPIHSNDGNATVGALLSFLSLRPGDTDREYFDNYTPAQVEFAQSHGEELSFFAMELESGAEDEDGIDLDDLPSAAPETYSDDSGYCAW